MLIGIVYVIRNGLQWKDSPEAYGLNKTLYNRFIRWSRLSVCDRIFAALSEQTGRSTRLMIDATSQSCMPYVMARVGLFACI
uniref:transposase n=1 Tax=Gluconobacter thailandicus TaxID=257438 RepID=UPI0009EE2087